MKGLHIITGTLGGHHAAVLLRDGQPDDLLLAPEGAELAPGAILRGQIGRPVKGMGGAFVRLPGGQNGFLRGTKGLAPGQTVLVQVAGHAEPGKAVPLSLRVALRGRHVVLTPGAPGHNISKSVRAPDAREALAALATQAMKGAPESLGLILRSGAAHATQAEIAAEIAALRAEAAAVAEAEGPPALLAPAPAIMQRACAEWPEASTDESPQAFGAHGLAEALAALFGPIPLPGGGRMHVEPTRALVAVDVDTGADTSPAAGLKANRAAALLLPRVLRLRGLGGQIVIDPAPMPRKERGAFEQALTGALRADPVETTLMGWTPLGHLELTRRRARLELEQTWLS